MGGVAQKEQQRRKNDNVRRASTLEELQHKRNENT
jgi:hypothetical protein